MRGLAIAGVFVGSLWLVGFGYLLASLWQAERPGAEALLAETNSRSLSSSGSCGLKSNVYHIVLDGMATDAVLEVIDGNSWTEKFIGFDLFFNNIANYLITMNSMTSYLTGKFYHSGNLRNGGTPRQKASSDVWPKAASASGCMAQRGIGNTHTSTYSARTSASTANASAR